MRDNATNPSSLRTQISIKNLLIIIAYLMNLTFFLAISYYPGKYPFFGENISDLGGTLSKSGIDNTTSMIIMIVGFCLCGLLTLLVGILYLTNGNLHLFLVKGIMAILMGFGAFLIAIPWDFRNLIILHGTGVVLFIGGFAAFNALVQISSTLKNRRKQREEINKTDTIMDIILSILLAVLLLGYFIIIPIARSNIGPENLEQAYQKIVVLTALLAIYFIDVQDI